MGIKDKIFWNAARFKFGGSAPTFRENLPVGLGLKRFKAKRFLYVPPGLKFKHSIWCSLCVECFVWISEQTGTFALTF